MTKRWNKMEKFHFFSQLFQKVTLSNNLLFVVAKSVNWENYCYTSISKDSYLGSYSMFLSLTIL